MLVAQTIQRLWPVALGFAMACQSSNQGEQAEEQPGSRPTVVQVEVAEASTIHDTIALTGVVQPFQHTRIAAGSGGKVDSIGVDEGQGVSQGAVLIRIAAGLASARYKQAEAALHAAKATFERQEKLADSALTSPQALEAAQTNLAQAEANFEIARVGLQDAVVRAPHAGRIAKKHISAGEQASPGAPLFDLVDLRKVKIIVQLPERDVPLVQTGSNTQITIDALPGETFTGIVQTVGILANASNRTFDMEIVADNPHEKLRPGMLGKVRITRRVLEDVPLVRRDAVVEGLNDRAVFIVENGNTARRQPVVLGPIQGKRVAVLEGVSPGDRVVIAGARFLVDGQPVTLATHQPPEPKIPVADVTVPETSVRAR